LEQLATGNPGVYELFPARLSKRAALDKELFAILVENAAKGIGPSATADTLVTYLAATWQAKELMWLGYLKRRRDNPQPNDNGTSARCIEKCPSYFSDEISGKMPSGSYLGFVFCKVITELRKYLDSDCIKRLVGSLFLSIDASY
jgi:hypothetical protein